MAKRKTKKAAKAKSTSKRKVEKKKRPAKKTSRRTAKPNRKSAKRADARRAGGAVAAVTAAAGLVNVELEKTSDSPALVEVAIEGTSRVVLALGEKNGSIAQVPVETFIRLWIRVSGNARETATIKVKRATPSPLTVTIPANTGQWAESQSILVTG